MHSDCLNGVFMLILVNDIMENNETEMVRTHEEDGGE